MVKNKIFYFDHYSHQNILIFKKFRTTKNHPIVGLRGGNTKNEKSEANYSQV